MTQVRAWYLPDVSENEIAEGLLRLRQGPAWVTSFVGDYASLAALKNMTSQLIGDFIRSVEAATRSALNGDPAPEEPLTRYAPTWWCPARRPWRSAC